MPGWVIQTLRPPRFHDDVYSWDEPSRGGLNRAWDISVHASFKTQWTTAFACSSCCGVCGNASVTVVRCVAGGNSPLTVAAAENSGRRASSDDCSFTVIRMHWTIEGRATKNGQWVSLSGFCSGVEDWFRDNRSIFIIVIFFLYPLLLSRQMWTACTVSTLLVLHCGATRTVTSVNSTLSYRRQHQTPCDNHNRLNHNFSLCIIWLIWQSWERIRVTKKMKPARPGLFAMLYTHPNPFADLTRPLVLCWHLTFNIYACYRFIAQCITTHYSYTEKFAERIVKSKHMQTYWKCFVRTKK